MSSATSSAWAMRPTTPPPLPGIHPEAVLQIRKCAYNGERLVEFDGARLTVARVDRSSPDYVRLTLTEVVGDRG